MKMTRKVAAEETLNVLKRGSYVLSKPGRDASTTLPSMIDINEQIQTSVLNCVCYEPDEEIEALPTVSSDTLMMVEVVDDSTLNCCKRLWKEVRP